MTDAERLIAVTNFDRWHLSLDHPDYDHACEHRPWEKKAYVAGYERAKRELEEITKKKHRKSMREVFSQLLNQYRSVNGTDFSYDYSHGYQDAAYYLKVKIKEKMNIDLQDLWEA